ncbi:MAG TPA: ABC transporter ATP-binding protein [Thermoanaerobaculia bacterium]|nr:ABC transporter ATP-binding protein [Thermoanaerobaculia bacterium]
MVPEIAAAAAPVLEVRNLTKVYPMGEVEVHALRGVSLTIAEGEFVVLLGPSGSGKSTLLNILGGLDVPTSGETLYRGESLSNADERQLTTYRRHKVGFVFQFYNLIPSLTARENVELATEIVEDPLSATDALALVGLAARVDHFPSQLSGGEQQRVAIARAIAKRPDLLLCDEPTGALDLATGVVVLEAIARVNEDLGTSVAVITHNSGIGDIADRVLSMSDGRIVGDVRNERRLSPSEIHW